jgi:acyl carrier protein
MDTSTRQTIVAFLARTVRTDRITDDLDLFAGGHVNSLFALQLIQFVEQTFGVRIESEDLELDNFRTVGAIEAFVARKRSA